MLKWLLDKSCPLGNETISAALGGQLEALKWLRKQNYPMGSDAFNSAAQGGHLKVLIWLKETGQMGDRRSAMLLASREGHFEVLEWLRQWRILGYLCMQGGCL